MANYRQIHVSIWKDEWFLDLEPQEKLLFIYLFGNEATSLSGIYKLPLKVILFETGLNKEYVVDTLYKFADAKKVFYEDGIVWVVHMRRYHETTSSKVQQRINADIALIPDCPLKIRYLYGMDTQTHLKEEEDKKEDESNIPNYSSSITAEKIWEGVTGFTTFISKSRDNDIQSIQSLIRKHGSNTVEFCKPFYDEWINRKYNKTNTAWLDWAITGEIPIPKKNGQNEDMSWTKELSTPSL